MSQTKKQPEQRQKSDQETALSDKEAEKEFETYAVDLPSPLDEIMLQLRVVVEGGSVRQLRDSVAEAIIEAEPKYALELREQMLRLRSIAEAMAQSAVEAYAAR